MSLRINAPMPVTPILLLADVYALTPCISNSILQLIDAGRLSGTGAMVTGPHWPDFAKPLVKRADRAEAGLHINLTLGKPLGPMPVETSDGHFPSMPVLSLKALFWSQARAAIQAEIMRQINMFRAHYGALPSYLDGHRHVHVLPGIREALFAAIQATDPNWTPLVRSVEEAWGRIRNRGISPFKTTVISSLSLGMQARARALGLRVNEGFSGVTDFDEKADFRANMREFLAISGPKPLIMVHPGLSGDEEIAALDAVVGTRPLEHAYLASADFLADLEAAGKRVGRLSDLFPNVTG
jgi:predicted glycoside hydrolase/deacetylase ChbG (UPF0249 family)